MLTILSIGILALVVWALVQEQLWRVAGAFLCALLAGVMTMNLFEPVARVLDASLPLGSWVTTISILGLFFGLGFTLTSLSTSLIPSPCAFHQRREQVARWLLAVVTAFIVSGVITTATRTMPLPASIVSDNPIDDGLSILAVDRYWVHLTSYLCRGPFYRNMSIPSEFAENGPDFNPAKVWSAFPPPIE